MSAIPKEWIEAGADAVYRHAARLGVPSHTLTAGQLVTAALAAVLPLIRESLAEQIEERADDLGVDAVLAAWGSDDYNEVHDLVATEIHACASIVRGHA